MQSSEALDVRRPGWLAPLLELYLELRKPLDSEAAVRAVKAAHPEAGEDELARALALRRLEAVGLHADLTLLPPRLRAHLQQRGIAYAPRRSRPDGAFQIFLPDPDGHMIELCTPPPSSPHN